MSRFFGVKNKSKEATIFVEFESDPSNELKFVERYFYENKSVKTPPKILLISALLNK